MLNYLKDLYRIFFENKSDTVEREDPSSYLNKPSQPSYYKRRIPVIVTDYLPSNVLGMTDLTKIWIRRLYGYLRERVINHELLHIMFPFLNDNEIEMFNRSGYKVRDLETVPATA